jgi:hypothetical protein
VFTVEVTPGQAPPSGGCGATDGSSALWYGLVALSGAARRFRRRAR